MNPPAGSPPPLEISHHCRISALDPERVWSLRGETLWMVTAGQADIPFPLRDAKRLRLEFSATRFQRNRYRCRLSNPGGYVAVIQNDHFKGMADFEDRSASYRELVVALIRRTSACNPGCRMITGTSMWNWLLSSGFLLLTFGFLAVVMFFMWTAVGWLVIVKLMVILFLLPTAIRWIMKNRPATFSAQSIPENLLPKIRTGAGKLSGNGFVDR